MTVRLDKDLGRKKLWRMKKASLVVRGRAPKRRVVWEEKWGQSLPIREQRAGSSPDGLPMSMAFGGGGGGLQAVGEAGWWEHSR